MYLSSLMTGNAKRKKSLGHWASSVWRQLKKERLRRWSLP
jgi:hypothetical protein